MLFLALTLFTWGDLSLQHAASLLQPVDAVGISFPVGTAFEHVETVPLSAVPVIVVTLKAYECPMPNFESDEIEIISPQGDSARAVGIQFHKECVVDFFVESKDFYSSSLFGTP